MKFLKENWYKLMIGPSMLIFACGFLINAAGPAYSNYNNNIQSINLDKIEPLVFASNRYISTDDSLNTSLIKDISANDSSETLKASWEQDADTANTESLAVVGLPEMRVLYRGYDNILEVAAFGFDPDQVTVTGSGCSISKRGNQYVATVGSGTREATISVNGRKADGGSVNLGSFKFKVKSLPSPEVYLGGISNGQTPGLSSVRAQTRVSCRYDVSIPLMNVSFSITGGTVSVDGFTTKGKVLSGGGFDKNAREILAQSAGKQVTITVNYRGPDGVGKIAGLVFTTR